MLCCPSRWLHDLHCILQYILFSDDEEITLRENESAFYRLSTHRCFESGTSVESTFILYVASRFVIATLRLMWEGPQVSADLERREEIRFIGSIKLLSGVALGCGGLSACWSLAWRWEREPCHWLLGSSPGLVTNYFNCWIFSWGLILCLEKYRIILIISQLPERNQMSEVTAAWVRLTFRWSSGTDLMIEAGTSGDNTNKTETCQGECL